MQAVINRDYYRLIYFVPLLSLPGDIWWQLAQPPKRLYLNKQECFWKALYAFAYQFFCEMSISVHSFNFDWNFRNFLFVLLLTLKIFLILNKI